MKGKVAIIGAGIAGLAAAQTLTQAGIGVSLFEKSRGVGGRLSTRRAGSLAFDHGAQFFTARGPAFAAQITRWQRNGSAALWQGERWVGMPAMTAPARDMADGLSVLSSHTITQASLRERMWHLAAAEAIALPDGFNALLLAVPAPQAEVLLATAQLSWPAVNQIRYAPCWALMLALSPDDALDPPVLWQGADPVIAWIARNSDKPGRSAQPACFVIHATAAWSRDNLELSAEQARDALLEALARLLGAWPEQPLYVQAHRWRYALVEQAAGQDCLWDPSLMIGACGDWCIGGRVEAAFDSGRALGTIVAQTLL